MSQEFGSPTPQKSSFPVWAWCIIVPCGCSVLIVPILAAILFPVFAQAREAARASSCGSNLRQQSLAVRMYVEDYDERLPPATAWMDLMKPYIKREDVFHCPNVSKDGESAYGYAYNKKLSLLPLDKLDVPFTTIMLYDSSDLSRSAADLVSSLPNPPRHRHSNNLSYADGHVNRTKPTTDRF